MHSFCSSCRLASLSLLAFAGVPAAPFVHAQGLTLSSGSAAISGSGTAFLAGSNYAYTGGAGAATSSYDSALTYEGQINLYAGSSINTLNTDNNPYSYGGFSIIGGSVNTINHADQGVGSISGGTIGTVKEFGCPACTLAVSGGQIDSIFISSSLSFGQNKASISGGSIQSITVIAGALTVSGGTNNSLTLMNRYEYHGCSSGPTTNISGGIFGTINATGQFDVGDTGMPAAHYDTCNISGGTFGTLDAANYGGYDIFGTNLSFSESGLITGTLANGQAIDAQYVNTDALGFLQFNNIPVPAAAVPEASITVSCGLLLVLGLGGVVIAAKKKKACAGS